MNYQHCIWNRASLGKESTCDVGDLGWEGLLEKEMATHSSILTWRIPWTEEPGRQSQRVRHDLATKQQQQKMTETALDSRHVVVNFKLSFIRSYYYF